MFSRRGKALLERGVQVGKVRDSLQRDHVGVGDVIDRRNRSDISYCHNGSGFTHDVAVTKAGSTVVRYDAGVVLPLPPATKDDD